MEIKGFITNLGKYNEGFLIGEWITFPVDEDELNDVLKRIGCCYMDEDGEMQNRDYEEYFFTDWDCEVSFNLGEYESIEKVNEIAETVGSFSSYEEDVFKAALEVYSLEEALDVNSFILLPDVSNEYDLGYYWAVESGCYEVDESNPLMKYIDYEAFGRDISIEADGAFTEYGWIERT